jgi:hypothetical protein
MMGSTLVLLFGVGLVPQRIRGDDSPKNGILRELGDFVADRLQAELNGRAPVCDM